MEGFSKTEREAAGKKGAVINISLVSSGLLPAGLSLEDTIGGRDNRPSYWILDEGVGLSIHLRVTVVVLMNSQEKIVLAHDVKDLL